MSAPQIQRTLPVASVYEIYDAMPEYFQRWSEPLTSGCILWTGSVNADGNGRVRLPQDLQPDGTFAGPETAHRAAWRVMVGPIPKGHRVAHKCQNAQCIRPDHLRCERWRLAKLPAYFARKA